MKTINLLIMTFILTSCQISDNSSVELAASGSDICAGKTILGIVGTANCSGSGSDSDPIMMLSFASRKDNASFPITVLEFTAFFAAPPRVVASLEDEGEENSTFTDNHSVIPNPFNDSDGRYQMADYNGNPIAASTEKKHYLETIAKNGPITTRANIVACGASGTIEARIDDCATPNGLWSFYDGKKYGQDGEGDWKLVSVLDNAGTKYEIWRDERTKLLWSDKSSANYNWYQAAGYSKPDGVSEIESEFISSPGNADPQMGTIMQPASPISVCPDVDAGEIAAGGGTATYTYVNPEANFKAGLSHPQTTWRLPSRSDWGLAEVNGIRKVLPNMDDYFWSSSSGSYGRSDAWYFYGYEGSLGYDYRYRPYSVRCVASSRD